MARNYESGGFTAHPNGDPLNVSTWTLSGWVYLDTVVNVSAMASFEYDGASIPMMMAIGNGGSEGTAGAWYTGYYHSGVTWRVANEGVVSPTGRWLHLVGTCTGTSVSLFRDGKLRATDTHGSGAWVAGGAGRDFRIGANWAISAAFDGRIAHVAAWTAVLGYEEITALYLGANPLTIRPGSLGSYWPMLGYFPDPDLGKNQLHMEVAGTTGPIDGSAVQPKTLSTMPMTREIGPMLGAIVTLPRNLTP